MDESLRQLLYRAMADTKFSKEAFSKVPLTEDYFGEALEVSRYIIKHYQKHDSPLSANELNLIISTELKATHKYTDETYIALVQDVNDIAELSHETNYSNSEEIQESTISWVRRKLFVKTVTQAVIKGDAIGPDDLEDTATALEDIAHLSTRNELGNTLSLFKADDKDRRKEYASKTYGNVISTGWKCLDAVADGGLAPGEMGLIIGSTGGGKSTILTNLAVNYSAQGKNVLYFLLEERMERMQNKIVSLIINQNRHYYYDEDEKLDGEKFDQVDQRVNSYYEHGIAGDIRLWEKEPDELTPKDLDKIMGEVLQMDGHYPDVIIVDYPELLKNPHMRSGANEYAAMGKLYVDLRAIAKRYNVVMWVASQSNRGAAIQEVNTAYSIEGSKQKMNNVELCFSLNQTEEEFNAGFIRLYMDKVRNIPKGEDGKPIAKHQMLQLKVNQQSVRITDETPEEAQAHSDLLDSKGNSEGKPSAFERSAKEMTDLRNGIPDKFKVKGA